MLYGEALPTDHSYFFISEQMSNFSKGKEHAENKLFTAKMVKFFFKRWRNIVEKVQMLVTILSFTTMFKRPFSLRNWNMIFCTGALYLQVLLLNFQNMIGEWQPPEGCEIAGPPRSNPVVGHVVQRLLNMVYPPSVCSHLENS